MHSSRSWSPFLCLVKKKLHRVVHDSLSLPPEKIFTVPTCMSCRSIVLSTKLSVKLIPASWSLTLSAHLSWIPSLTIILLWMFSENVYASKLLPTLLTDSPEIQYARLRDGSISNHFFIEEDSTNAVKFSRHLIFFVQPGVVFRNYKEVKFFVNRLLNSIHEEALFDSNSKTFQNIESGQDAGRILLMRKLFVLKSIGGEDVWI